MGEYKFKIGDILTINKTEYYIVIDYLVSEGENYCYVEQVMEKGMLLNHVKRLTILEKDLELYRAFGTKDAEIVYNFLKKERVRLGLYDEPSWGVSVESTQTIEERVETANKKTVLKPTKPTKQPVKQMNTLDHERLFKNNEGELIIKYLLERLDTKLSLLSKAIISNNNEDIDRLKEELEDIRLDLTKLEYFDMIGENKRRR